MPRMGHFWKCRACAFCTRSPMLSMVWKMNVVSSTVVRYSS